MTNDPYDSASTAQVKPAEYFGQAQVDVWYCVLVKGTGKVPFDAQAHKVEDRRTAVDVLIQPLSDHNLQYVLERKMIAESKEWAGTVWGSLKALGMKSLRELNEKWVKVAMVPNGSYTDATGNVKQKTTFKFLALYESEEQCRNAYLAGSPAKQNGHTQPDPTAVQQTASNSGKEREVALKFLPAIVNKNAGDLDALAKALASAPLVQKYFTIDSAEVLELLAKQAA